MSEEKFRYLIVEADMNVDSATSVTGLNNNNFDEYQAERRELLTTIDHLESERRALAKKFNQLREAAYALCASANYQYVNEDLLRHLGNIIDFPNWYEL